MIKNTLFISAAIFLLSSQLTHADLIVHDISIDYDDAILFVDVIDALVEDGESVSFNTSDIISASFIGLTVFPSYMNASISPNLGDPTVANLNIFEMDFSHLSSDYNAELFNVFQVGTQNFIPMSSITINATYINPVPVPAAGWLFMSALVGLIGKRRVSRR